MCAGPKYEYMWADGQTIKKPISCSAPRYVDYLLTWVPPDVHKESARRESSLLSRRVRDDDIWFRESRPRRDIWLGAGMHRHTPVPRSHRSRG